MRDGAFIKALHQLLLVFRATLVNIHHDKIHAVFVLLVQIHEAASLPLGVESTFAKENDVIGFALDQPLVHVVAGDEAAVLAVAGIIEMLVQL